jgi:ABC-type glutathione transport system ATPase component
MTDALQTGAVATRAAQADDAIVSARELTKIYSARGVKHTAVDAVSFDVPTGTIFGIVGESGSGKTTVAKMMLSLVRPSSGQMLIEGIDVARASRGDRRQLHRTIQVVFQDPYSSMNPRLRIRRILAEGITRVKPRDQVDAEVDRLLGIVGLPNRYASLLPHELSGGQRQRVAIARALSVGPSVLVADEPVSALDVSMRGQVLNLLASLRTELNLTCIFISHDLGVVRQLCDDVVVMRLGQVVERGDPEAVFSNPQHPYTQQLVAAIPRIPT